MQDDFADAVAHVFYINLDIRPDRDAHMRRLLANCPWPWSRLSATRLQQPPESLGLPLRPALRETPHVASIWLSHRRALEAMLALDTEGAFLLLEDDVQVRPELFASGVVLPAGLPPRWEICLVSPRWKRLLPAGPDGIPEHAWILDPLPRRPVPARDLGDDIVVTGAHFCVVNGRAGAASLLARMDAAPEIYDVDAWYVQATDCLLHGNPWVGTAAALGTNHFDGVESPVDA